MSASAVAHKRPRRFRFMTLAAVIGAAGLLAFACLADKKPAPRGPRESREPFPPAPRLNVLGHLDPTRATEAEQRGEKLFFGKAMCATCHPAPFYIDHLMHDLHIERFINEPPLGPITTFTLRGIKDRPPSLHDGRCLTLEDTGIPQFAGISWNQRRE